MLDTKLRHKEIFLSIALVKQFNFCGREHHTASVVQKCFVRIDMEIYPDKTRSFTIQRDHFFSSSVSRFIE